MALDKERVRQSIENLLREPGRLRFVVGTEPVDDDGELVARKAPDNRMLRQRRRQSFGNRLERRVAGQVAEGVVDLLEMVDVHVEQAQ